MPWLFPDPGVARLEWQGRYLGFLQSNSLELERLRAARNNPSLTESGRARITRLLQAREQYRREIAELLAPLELEDLKWPADSADLLHGKLPRRMGLCGYMSNVFRDWSWNNGENEAQLDAVDSVLEAAGSPDFGRVLSLGAGSCRLPYDLHRRFSPRQSIALDANPLLLEIASRVISGSSVALHEFPVAPLNAAASAVGQLCAAPEALAGDDFLFVCADALSPPFAPESVDTVVTPWLIDIIPQNLVTLLSKINRLLPNGGTWVNTGSLAFFNDDAACRYSEEEVVTLIENAGFELLATERRRVPYLQSPHGAYGRVECILSFVARKTASFDEPAYDAYLPRWILDTNESVPAGSDTAIGASNHLLKAHVLSSVDGKRTINQISRFIARQYGLGRNETLRAVRRVLIDAWETRLEDLPGDDP